MYNVGDVLWIISQDKPGVLPYRVIEEVTKKTLEGSTTQYVVETPNKNRSRLLKDNDDVYTSIESVKSELVSRAENAIDKMLAIGTQQISKWSDDLDVIVNKSNNDNNKSDTSDNTIGEETVTLPDGQKVKINFKGDIP